MENSGSKGVIIGVVLLMILAMGYGIYALLDTGQMNSMGQMDTAQETKQEKKEDGLRTVNKISSLPKDFSGAKVAKEDLVEGCFGGMDCIPAIDKPRFETAKIGDQWLEDDDRVFGLNYKGEFRAYPQRILNWHEIVNDVVGDEPVLVTFCPLCGSAVAFVPKVNGVKTEFGVSGLLHNSDLVMYDRLEGNLWQQITGEAIVGEAAQRGEILGRIDLATTTWKEWLAAHPETKVLSRETGHIRNYDEYPYGTYEEDDKLMFGVENENRALPLKEPVYGVEIEMGHSEVVAKAYTVAYVDEKGEFEDSVGGVELKFVREPSGTLTITRKDNDQKIPYLRAFWFAWAAFHPDTEVGGEL